MKHNPVNYKMYIKNLSFKFFKYINFELLFIKLDLKFFTLQEKCHSTVLRTIPDFVRSLLCQVTHILTVELLRVQLSSEALMAKRSHRKDGWEATHPFSLKSQSITNHPILDLFFHKIVRQM